MKFLSVVPKRITPVQVPTENPIHQIRNQLCVVQLAIEINRPDLSIHAVREIEGILGPLEAILKMLEPPEVRH